MDSDSEPYPGPVSYRQSENFYFPDGNVCLISCNNVVFRVLRSQLASQSEYFDLLLTMLDEQRTGSGKIYEGVPVLELEESDTGLEHLFTVMWLAL